MSQGDHTNQLLEELRAEEPLAEQATRRAMLRYELGALSERNKNADGAAKDYFAAHDADPALTEPLHALARLFRRRADPNLGRVLERLIELAPLTDTDSRALWELAVFRQEIENDLSGAREALEAASERDPANVENWLQLELVAAVEHDDASRMRAIEARAQLTENPAWQAMLLLGLSDLLIGSGDFDRARDILDTAAAADAPSVQWLVSVAIERLAERADNTAWATVALRMQAELLTAAATEVELAAWVPAVMRTHHQAAEAWIRLASAQRRDDQAPAAMESLEQAGRLMPESPTISRMRLGAADAAKDGVTALQLARAQVEAGVEGKHGAALWLRVGIAHERLAEVAEATQAYEKALALDPESAAARTLLTDLVALGEDPAVLGQQLADTARAAAESQSKVSYFILSSFVASVRAGDEEAGKVALRSAEEHGLPPLSSLKLARSFAAMAQNDSWYEEATRSLYDVARGREKAMIGFELGRLALRNGDETAAGARFGALADDSDGEASLVWLGKALGAFASGLANAEGDGARDALEVAAFAAVEPDDETRLGLAIVAAVTACRAQEVGGAIELLEQELEVDPANLVVALFVADLHRIGGNLQRASDCLLVAAAAVQDEEMAAALELEGGMLMWRGSNRAGSVAAFERALPRAPASVRVVLTWALRALDPDNTDGRLRALDAAATNEMELPAALLERAGLFALHEGGTDDALSALDDLDGVNPGGDIALASALIRLLLQDGSSQGPAAEALERLSAMGGSAESLAAAERYRVARLVERDALGAVERAKAWAAADNSIAACLEWISACLAADDIDGEIDAREGLVAAMPEGDPRTAVQISADVLKQLHRPGANLESSESASSSARLWNLDLALSSDDSPRRAAALNDAIPALGEGAQREAQMLSAWSELAAGEERTAQQAFKALIDAHPNDLVAWEGLRAASTRLKDFATVGVALARMGHLCSDPSRSALLWERAGLVLLKYTEAHDDAEIAFTKALELDARRSVAFDKLFRRIRSRNEDDRLLHLIALRLQIADKPQEVTKMYWERARVLRRKGDTQGALASLNDVAMMDPDHVGALALAGEIHITAGNFAQAAPLLEQLALSTAAPRQQRLMSGVAAVDLYQKKLKDPEKAIGILARLHRDGLSTLKVRERLARAAARLGQWALAVSTLEELMGERDTSDGRAEAARLAMVICRDKLREPQRAAAAIGKLLEEIPDEPEALEMLLRSDVSDDLKTAAIPVAGKIILDRLRKNPFDGRRLELAASIAEAQNNPNLQRAALGCVIALGKGGRIAKAAVAELDARTARDPQIVLDDDSIYTIAHPKDSGPTAALFARMDQVIGEAIPPTIKSLKLGRKQRVSDGALRLEVARWMSALGIDEFDLYVSGEGETVVGIADDKASLVIGSGLKAPLNSRAKSAVAREVFALRRGTTAVLRCDDSTLASVVIAASRDAGVDVAEPQYAVYREVERAMKKAMSRKVRKAIAPICGQIVDDGLKVAAWAQAARESIDRMSLIASGDVSSVLDNMLGPVGTPERSAVEASPRAKSVLQFALSPDYLKLRAKLGMGVK